MYKNKKTMKKRTLTVGVLILSGIFMNTTIQGLDLKGLEKRVKTDAEVAISSGSVQGTAATNGTKTQFLLPETIFGALAHVKTSAGIEGIAKMATFFKNNPILFTEIYTLCENVTTCPEMNYLFFVVTSAYHGQLIITGKFVKSPMPEVVGYLVDKYNTEFVPQKSTTGKITTKEVTETMMNKIVGTSLTDVKGLPNKRLMSTFLLAYPKQERNTSLEQVKEIVLSNLKNCSNNWYFSWSIDANLKIEEPVLV